MESLLFIYGTLHPSLAPDRLSDIVCRLKLVDAATVKGTIYSLGRYPGVVLGGEGEVHGYVYQLPNDPSSLMRLDRYEGYEAGQADGCLFVRVACNAKLDDGRAIECWIYVYNQSLDGARAVESGNWLESRLKAVGI